MLHNIIIDLQETAVDEAQAWPSDHDAKYRQQVCQLADENGVRVRDKLSQHLISK